MKSFLPASILVLAAIVAATLGYSSRGGFMTCGDSGDQPQNFRRVSSRRASAQSVTPSLNGPQAVAVQDAQPSTDVERPELPPHHGSRPQVNASGAVAGVATRHFPKVSEPAVTSASYRPSQPAVWADCGDAMAADPTRDPLIQQAAEQLAEQIAGPGFATDSEAYRAHWEASVAASDQLFRQRYGRWVWMAYHLRAHQLAATQQSDMQ